MNKYCNNLSEYSRFITREVKVGNVAIGKNNPIRIQSMTTTNTMDTIATVEQSIRMYKSGSELVRITAPSIKEAMNLRNIKDELKKRGYNFPLIADIHFTPNAAEEAARIVEKVRVNPGNYVDKKKFDKIEYSDSEYNDEIERIAKRFTPLVKICKEYGTAIRIGTNHGSLSDRIMSRYGDTPIGMVESALEFVRICEANNFYDIILSMKSSNPQVMVHAYRLLTSKMISEGMNYPLHLGVTEAGDGDDARIKSSVGIGALLEDGIGDTIRVSLTEPPENESPVAKKIISKYLSRGNAAVTNLDGISQTDPFKYNPRKSNTVADIGGNNFPVVIADASNEITNYELLSKIGYHKINMSWKKEDTAPDYIYFGDKIPEIELLESLNCIVDYSTWVVKKEYDNFFPLLNINDYLDNNGLSSKINFLLLQSPDLSEELQEKIKNDSTIVLILKNKGGNGIHFHRNLIWDLIKSGITSPIIIKNNYELKDPEQLVIDSATDFGTLFLEGMGNGIWISNNDGIDISKINSTCFGILQATRTRITKTEYISCPSCGRTLFDLVEVTNKIRSKTNHLKGVKIGIMGCIVNGPGEMADADYGYVGSGAGKISLYRGQKVVMKNIEQNNAVEKLIELIKEDGKWVEE